MDLKVTLVKVVGMADSEWEPRLGADGEEVMVMHIGPRFGDTTHPDCHIHVDVRGADGDNRTVRTTVKEFQQNSREVIMRCTEVGPETMPDWHFHANDHIHGQCYGLTLGDSLDEVVILERHRRGGWELILPGGELFETARNGFELVNTLMGNPGYLVDGEKPAPKSDA